MKNKGVERDAVTREFPSVFAYDGIVERLETGEEVTKVIGLRRILNNRKKISSLGGKVGTSMFHK